MRDAQENRTAQPVENKAANLVKNYKQNIYAKPSNYDYLLDNDNIKQLDICDFKEKITAILLQAQADINFVKKVEKVSLHEQRKAIIDYIRDTLHINTDKNHHQQLELALNAYLKGQEDFPDLSFLQLDKEQKEKLETFLSIEENNPKYHYENIGVAVNHDTDIIKLATVFLKEYDRRREESPQDFPLADEEAYNKVTDPSIDLKYKTTAYRNFDYHLLRDQELDALSVQVSCFIQELDAPIAQVSNSIQEVTEPATEELAIRSTNTLSYIGQYLKQVYARLAKRFKKPYKINTDKIGTPQQVASTKGVLDNLAQFAVGHLPAKVVPSPDNVQGPSTNVAIAAMSLEMKAQQPKKPQPKSGRQRLSRRIVRFY